MPIVVFFTSFNVSSAVEQNNTFCSLQDSSYIIKHDLKEYEVYSDIIINATPDQVWSVLTDFDKTSQWSSNFYGLVGDVRDGGMVVAKYKVGKQVIDFPHTLNFRPRNEFSWSSPIVTLPGIKDDHHFIVTATDDNKTRFVQKDTYTGEHEVYSNGVTSLVTAKYLAEQQSLEFRKFNRELKFEVEKIYNVRD